MELNSESEFTIEKMIWRDLNMMLTREIPVNTSDAKQNSKQI